MSNVWNTFGYTNDITMTRKDGGLNCYNEQISPILVPFKSHDFNLWMFFFPIKALNWIFLLKVLYWVLKGTSHSWILVIDSTSKHWGGLQFPGKGVIRRLPTLVYNCGHEQYGTFHPQMPPRCFPMPPDVTGSVYVIIICVTTSDQYCWKVIIKLIFTE